MKNFLCYVLFMISLPIFIFGQSQQVLNYIYDCESGICKELLHKDSTVNKDFTSDNEIYRYNLEFVFQYKYIQQGKEYLIGNQGHILEPIDSIDDHTIVEISFHCSQKEEEMWKIAMPNYPQSIIRYDYYNRLGESFSPFSTSGLIENEKNIWIHPF